MAKAQVIFDNNGAKRLIASILSTAHSDIKHDKSCINTCCYKGTCELYFEDAKSKDAQKFIKTKWCETLCDGIDIDYDLFRSKCEMEVKNNG